MIRVWRPLLLAVVFCITVGRGAATAQSIIVTNAAPGDVVEVSFGATAAGTATADAMGVARIPLTLVPGPSPSELVLDVFVDACGTERHVVLVTRGSLPPPPEAGCARREVVGPFVVRRVTTLVVDVSGSTPTLRIRQGAAPRDWLTTPSESPAARRMLPTGLMLFGGAGPLKFRDVVSTACGGVLSCSKEHIRPAYSAGAVYWISRYVGAEVAYHRPTTVQVSGSGDGFRFNHTFESDVLQVAGNLGATTGRVRLYAQVGASHHWAVASATQTTDDVTLIVDGVSQTLAGGTQTFVLQTAGWGWLFGGGAEVWLTDRFAIYAQFDLAALKGTDIAATERLINDRATLLMIGGRVRLGGFR